MSTAKPISLEQYIGMLREEASRYPYDSVYRTIYLRQIQFITLFCQKLPPSMRVQVTSSNGKVSGVSVFLIREGDSKPFAGLVQSVVGSSPHSASRGVDSVNPLMAEDLDFPVPDRIQAVREADKILDKLMGK